MSEFLTPLVVQAILPKDLGGKKTQLWLLREDLHYQSDLFGKIVVPKGYLTDFASIPSAFKNYMDDDDPGILMPSCVHDWLYANKGELSDGHIYDRKAADSVLDEAMKLCGARWDQRQVVYRMVRLFGGSHWKPSL